MPSSKTTPSQGNTLLDEMEIRDMDSVPQYRPGAKTAAGLVPGTSSKIGGQNIVTVEMPKEQLVQQFEPGRIHDTKGVRYSDVAKGIPTAVARAAGHFRLNALTRGPLSVEAEEEERIETEVQARLARRLDEMREQVTADAYRAGFEAGKDDGRQEISTQLKPQLERFERLIAEFDSMRDEIFKANEELLLHMVNQLTKAVVLRELKDDKDYARRLAVHLLERVGARENIKLYVSEEELAAADALKEGLTQSLGQLKNISIEADSSLKAGGCRVETEFGEIDGRIEVQLQNIALGLGTDSAKPSS